MIVKPNKIFLTGISEFMNDTLELIDNSNTMIVGSEFNLKTELVSVDDGSLSFYANINKCDLDLCISVAMNQDSTTADVDWLLDNDFSLSEDKTSYVRYIHVELRHLTTQWNKQDNFFQPCKSENPSIDWSVDVDLCAGVIDIHRL